MHPRQDLLGEPGSARHRLDLLDLEACLPPRYARPGLAGPDEDAVTPLHDLAIAFDGDCAEVAFTSMCAVAEVLVIVTED